MIEIFALLLCWGYVTGFLCLTAATSRRSGKQMRTSVAEKSFGADWPHPF